MDHLNSTKVVTDENGVVEVSYTYRAFGEQLKRLDNSGTPTDDKAKYSYDGKELDDGTNLYYFNARYYDATIGRFINVDPVQDGSNWYVYCNNNPLCFVDPTGLTVNGSVIESNKDEDNYHNGSSSYVEVYHSGESHGDQVFSMKGYREEYTHTEYTEEFLASSKTKSMAIASYEVSVYNEKNQDDKQTFYYLRIEYSFERKILGLFSTGKQRIDPTVIMSNNPIDVEGIKDKIYKGSNIKDILGGYSFIIGNLPLSKCFMADELINLGNDHIDYGNIESEANKLASKYDYAVGWNERDYEKDY